MIEAKRPCRTCGKPCSYGYCERHKKPTKDNRRLNANARGYNWKWRQFRERYLIAHPLCVDCESRGVLSDASEIHHREKLERAPQRKFDLGNLLALCNGCHTSRTRRGE